MSNLLNRFRERKNLKAKQRDYDRQTAQKYGVTQKNIDKERRSNIRPKDLKLSQLEKFGNETAEEKIERHVKTKVLPAMYAGTVKWVGMMGQQKGWWR